jgi:hypothetical protein
MPRTVASQPASAVRHPAVARFPLVSCRVEHEPPAGVTDRQELAELARVELTTRGLNPSGPTLGSPQTSIRHTAQIQIGTHHRSPSVRVHPGPRSRVEGMQKTPAPGRAAPTNLRLTLCGGGLAHLAAVRHERCHLRFLIPGSLERPRHQNIDRSAYNEDSCGDQPPLDLLRQRNCQTANGDKAESGGLSCEDDALSNRRIACLEPEAECRVRRRGERGCDNQERSPADKP